MKPILLTILAVALCGCRKEPLPDVTALSTDTHGNYLSTNDAVSLGTSYGFDYGPNPYITVSNAPSGDVFYTIHPGPTNAGKWVWVEEPTSPP